MQITSEQESKIESIVRGFATWAHSVRLTRKLTFALVFAAAIAGLATYAAWTGTAPVTPDPNLVLILLVIDLVLLLSLGAVIARQLVRLWLERRIGSAGSRLHTRFVALFSLVAVGPAIVVAVFSATFFYLGIQSWFSERIRTVVEESEAVAEAYVDEHRNTIRADILAMARDVNRVAPRLLRNQAAFNWFIRDQALKRALGEVTVFDASGRVLGRTTLSLAAAFQDIPIAAIDRAVSGDVVIFGSRSEDRVRALVKLDIPLDAYLYVARFVDHRVLNHAQRTRDVVSEFRQLELTRFDIQLTSALIFIVVALMLLMVAVWLGLTFANRLVGPIRALVESAEQVRQGNLSVRVAEGIDDDEIGTLSRAFNRMTRQLESQRAELIEANRQMDHRRRFTEAVLSGVSAGVIGLDGDGIVELPNQSAAELLETPIEDITGKHLSEVVPEMSELLDKAKLRGPRVVEGQIRVVHNGHNHFFMVRIGADRRGREGRGFVVTFDDVTELVAAQRTAAWADVARRIAHEIKNPLTPIQLSAERLKRKYLRQIEEDQEVFTQCTDTIIRQVSDIRSMVDEFSAFARMPAPVLKDEDVCEIMRQAVFPQRFGHNEIDYVLNLPATEARLHCDARLLTQVLTNLLQNAADAIDGRVQNRQDRGHIEISLHVEEAGLRLEIADNGRGLPAEDRDRLTEPYVTTRAKGTGLGLAIVRKIVEEHGWRLELKDGEETGAVVSVLMTERAIPAGDAPEEERNDNEAELGMVSDGG
jgi:two-component system nitrogen regulation sensor histidine kinase NtrY